MCASLGREQGIAAYLLNKEIYYEHGRRGNGMGSGHAERAAVEEQRWNQQRDEGLAL